VTLLSDSAAAGDFTVAHAADRPRIVAAPRRAKAGRRIVADDRTLSGKDARPAPGKLGAPVALAAAMAEPRERDARPARPADVAPYDHGAARVAWRATVKRELARAAAEDAARLAARLAESARWFADRQPD
jgi:hypothetical protein